jgi:hypothetical protein
MTAFTSSGLVRRVWKLKNSRVVAITRSVPDHVRYVVVDTTPDKPNEITIRWEEEE